MNFRKGLIVLSIILYVASLFCPVFEDMDLFGGHREKLKGYAVLWWGWYVIPSFHPAWLANISWLVGIILFLKKRYKWSLYLSIVTVMLAADSFLFPSQWYIGFYLWNVAVSSLLLINLLEKIQNRRAAEVVR